MFSIGNFAALTGLSVKALRHYDDIGLLHPDHVDPQSGYRYYTGEQARSAATIAVLRSMGMPVPMVQQALKNPDRVDALTEEFAQERQARREAEDRMSAACRKMLADYDAPLTVQRRDADPVNWVGFQATLGDGDEEAADFNAGFDRFFTAVHEAGLEPLGYWWMTFDLEQDEDSGFFATSWAIPVQSLPPVGMDLGREYTTGTLPVRVEHAVRLGEDPAIDEEVSGPHAGLLALLESGLEITRASQVRQVYLPQQDGGMRMAMVVDVVS